MMALKVWLHDFATAAAPHPKVHREQSHTWRESNSDVHRARPTHLLSWLSWFAVALPAAEALGGDGALRSLHDELGGQELLDVLQDVPLHL